MGEIERFLNIRERVLNTLIFFKVKITKLANKVIYHMEHMEVLKMKEKRKGGFH